jgi:chitinase
MVWESWFYLFWCFTILGNVIGFVFSPYKDVTINLDWNTFVLSTAVTGSPLTLINALPLSGTDTITWAFATGQCGTENWGGINATELTEANIKSWESSSKYFIVSAGGAAGSFKCSSDAGFKTFLDRYYSVSMIGVDFDIEGGKMSQQEIEDLIRVIKNAQPYYPAIKIWSFTLATLGGESSQSLGDDGIKVMNALKTIGLTNYVINLMTMDYGVASPYNCVLGVDGSCDMGKSAIKAAMNLHEYYGVPYSRIHLTPMIGSNDTPGEIFNHLDDIDEVSAFILSYGIGGLHHWSFDRDVDCPPGYPTSDCNSYGLAGPLGFTTRFATLLAGDPASPAPSPVGAPTTMPVVVPSEAPVTSPSTSGDELCQQANCHGCLWVGGTGMTCFPTYPKDACEVYIGQGYYWCP